MPNLLAEPSDPTGDSPPEQPLEPQRQYAANESPMKRGAVTLLGSLILLLAVAGVLGTIAYLKYSQIQTAMAQPPPPEMPVAVSLFEAASAKVSPKTTVVGTVLAPRTVTLRNEESGTVTEVLMQPGGIVKSGETLVKMDTRVEQAQLDAALATLTESKSNLSRAERLAQSSAVSREELDAATASVARSKAEVSRLEAIIDRKQLRAPFDARVGLFQLHVGQYLDIGAELVTLEGTDGFLLVDFAVPAHVADTLNVGSEVTMQASRGSDAMAARVDAMDSRADAESRLLTMRAKLDSPPASLLPGDSVLVTVAYGQPLPVTLVPQTAVRRGPSGESVFVAKSIGEDEALRAVSIPIVTAGNDGRRAHVVSGLTAGDQVVADGSFKVQEGSLLKAVQP